MPGGGPGADPNAAGPPAPAAPASVAAASAALALKAGICSSAWLCRALVYPRATRSTRLTGAVRMSNTCSTLTSSIARPSTTVCFRWTYLIGSVFRPSRLVPSTDSGNGLASGSSDRYTLNCSSLVALNGCSRPVRLVIDPRMVGPAGSSVSFRSSCQVRPMNVRSFGSFFHLAFWSAVNRESLATSFGRLKVPTSLFTPARASSSSRWTQ